MQSVSHVRSASTSHQVTALEAATIHGGAAPRTPTNPDARSTTPASSTRADCQHILGPGAQPGRRRRRSNPPIAGEASVSTLPTAASTNARAGSLAGFGDVSRLLLESAADTVERVACTNTLAEAFESIDFIKQAATVDADLVRAVETHLVQRLGTVVASSHPDSVFLQAFLLPMRNHPPHLRAAAFLGLVDGASQDDALLAQFEADLPTLPPDQCHVAAIHLRCRVANGMALNDAKLADLIARIEASPPETRTKALPHLIAVEKTRWTSSDIRSAWRLFVNIAARIDRLPPNLQLAALRALGAPPIVEADSHASHQWWTERATAHLGKFPSDSLQYGALLTGLADGVGWYVTEMRAVIPSARNIEGVGNILKLALHQPPKARSQLLGVFLAGDMLPSLVWHGAFATILFEPDPSGLELAASFLERCDDTVVRRQLLEAANMALERTEDPEMLGRLAAMIASIYLAEGKGSKIDALFSTLLERQKRIGQTAGARHAGLAAPAGDTDTITRDIACFVSGQIDYVGGKRGETRIKKMLLPIARQMSIPDREAVLGILARCVFRTYRPTDESSRYTQPSTTDARSVVRQEILRLSPDGLRNVAVRYGDLAPSEDPMLAAWRTTLADEMIDADREEFQKRLASTTPARPKRTAAERLNLVTRTSALRANSVDIPFIAPAPARQSAERQVPAVLLSDGILRLPDGWTA